MSKVSQNIEHFKRTRLKNELENAMGKVCAMVANSASQKAPHRTGTLDGSIQFEVDSDSPACIEGIVYTNTEYAPYVEFGTGIYATKGDGRKTPWRYKSQDGWFTTQGQKAQPFMKPALDENKDNIAAMFGRLF